MQNKTIMSNDYTPIRVAQTQTVTAPQAGEAVEWQKLSLPGGDVKWYSFFGRQFHVLF